jgi:hypothetical protein
LLLSTLPVLDEAPPLSLHLNVGPATVSTAGLICSQQPVKGTASKGDLS